MDPIVLRNGIRMPVLGFGVYKIPPGAETETAVRSALEIGYRLLDTAAYYRNEADIGKAVRESGVAREEVFITSKLHPIRCFNVEGAFYESLAKLGLDYLDLYLTHFPFFRKRAVWKVLQKLYAKGAVKAIGVSNYRIRDIKTITKDGAVPMVNQVEFHPFLYRKDLLAYCQEKSIALEAHSPLMHGKRLGDPRIATVAKRYGKSPAQILIRWSMQHGLAVIPKTTHPERMRENFQVFDFSISAEDMQKLDTLNEDWHVAKLSKIIGDS